MLRWRTDLDTGLTSKRIWARESGEKLADGEAIVLIDEPPEYSETF